MRKLLNKPWFVVLLVVAAGGAVWYSIAPYISSPSAGISAAPVPEPEATVDTGTSGNDNGGTQDSPQNIPQTKVSRDPFAIAKTNQPEKSTQPAEAPPAEPDIVETVHLAALWTQDGKTLVFLNDHVHNTGDSIGRIKIESASPKGIWLSHPRGTAFLEVGKSFVLKTPARLATKLPSQTTP